jgi:hypothetical protein
LAHVYWIGGGSGAGKSTIAAHLAARYGLRHYATDDAMADHGRRSTPADAPLLHRFAAMDFDERWLTRDVPTMLASFHWYQGEGFGLIVEDLLALPRRPAVVVDGFRLLPDLVAPLLADPARAVWLLPTPRFRRAALAGRGSLWTIAGRTSDPHRALAKLLERDALFTDRLRADTRRLGLPAVEVDIALSEDDLAAQVSAGFGL